MRVGCTILLALAACHARIVNPFPENFVGVGVELTMRDQVPVVVRTLTGGPAEQAGLTTDDRVVAIDNTPTKGLPLADVVVRLRGAEGSPVMVTLRRNGIDIEARLLRRDMARTENGYAARQ